MGLLNGRETAAQDGGAAGAELEHQVGCVNQRRANRHAVHDQYVALGLVVAGRPYNTNLQKIRAGRPRGEPSEAPYH